MNDGEYNLLLDVAQERATFLEKSQTLIHIFPSFPKISGR